MSGYPTVSVDVRLPKASSPDPFMSDTGAYSEPVTVEGALVAPGATDDVGPERPEGVSVDYTVHVPRSFDSPLRGAQVKVDGEWLDVVGDPRAYPDAALPSWFPWNRKCEVGHVSG